ncbi:hypothetical protein DITRI_Ditri02bG0076800 [Diplodiscus trichospermus]
MNLFYTALILIIGTITIAIIIYTFVMIGSCANPPSSPLPRHNSHVGEKGSSAQLNMIPYSASSFKFSKGLDLDNVEATEKIKECVVCLLRFQDDEEVRQLHRCKHCFHAPCIDMWMYSHLNNL